MAGAPPGLPRRLVGAVATALVLPVVLWLVGSFAAPVVCNALKRPDAFLRWLASVEADEEAHARLMTPRLVVAGRECWAAAWPYLHGRELVDRWLPPESSAMARPVRDGSGNPALAKLASDGHAYFEHRVVPLQRHWLAIAATRAWYGAEAVLIALPLTALAFALGEYRSRLKREQGIQPLGHRYRLWAGASRAVVTLAPTVLIVPLAVPASLLFAACAFAFAIAILGARSHALEL
ncbi:MAG TPA: hypothetical protein VEL07_22350 [Planctomycetota bacterium]|nr:hypothetical protein [Planctomycetota bacterium]